MLPLLLALASALAPGQVRGDAQPVRAQVVEALARRSELLSNVHVTTHMLADRPGRPAGAYLRAELKILGPERFFLDFAHGWPGMPWRDDSTRHRSFVVDGEYLAEKPAQRTFVRRPLEPDELPERFAVHPFVLSAGWWPDGSSLPCPELAGRPLSVLRAARDERYAITTLAPGADGECDVVLERPGLDRIVLSGRHGLAPSARDFHDEELGTVHTLLRVDEFVPLGDGLWTAARFRILISDATATSAQEAPILETRSVELVQAELGSVRPVDFVFTPPPGAFQLDRRDVAAWRQVEPGGLELLESAADALASASPRPGPWALLRSILLCALVGSLLGWSASRLPPWIASLRAPRKEFS